MNRRKKKLILTSFQLRCIALAASVALLAVVVQSLVFALLLQAPGTEGLPPEQRAEWVGGLLRAGGIGFVLLLPFLVSVGLVVTHRIAGPIYRFQEHLKAIAEGRAPGPCKIRRQDEFQELCRRINEAVDALEGDVEAAAAVEPLETEQPIGS